MPRIRKKTSKRVNLHKRARIKDKARETRKKQRRDTKRNPQWKSKKAKDPGIPANFPYKDQILAEIAEERRQAAEAKEKRKEDKQAAKLAGGDALVAGTSTTPGTNGTLKAVHPVASDDEDAPILLNPDYPHFQAIFEKSDVILHVLDARDPLSFRSSQIESLVSKKSEQRIVFVLNKADMCPRESVAAWAAYLRASHPTLIFSASGDGPKAFQNALGVNTALELLGEWAEQKNEDLVVAVVGTTNVGKSSVINALSRKPSCPVYKLSNKPIQTPSTTMYPQEIVVNVREKSIRLIDTPGLFWEYPDDASKEDAASLKARDILLRSRGRIDHLKDPLPPLSHIVPNAKKQDLMLQYNLPAFADNDVGAFLNGVARSNNLLTKTAEPDKILAARIVLRDWNTGKFPRFTLPPSSPPTSNTTDTTLSGVHAKDDAVLSKLRTRTEFRRSGGLVKMNSGGICERTLILDAEWVSPEDSEPSGDEDEDEEMLDFHGNDGDDEDDDDEDEEDEEEDGDGDGDEDDDEEESEVELPPLPSKRKRPSEPPKGSSIPKKRVTFDLQKPARGIKLPSKHAPLNQNIKKSIVALQKRR